MSQTPISAKDAARLAGRSKSQIHRDVLNGRLPVAQQYPGYNGPRLFDPEVVADHYGVKAAS